MESDTWYPAGSGWVGHQTAEIDPLLPFKIGPMNGRNAPGAGIPGGRSERVRSTEPGCCKLCWRSSAWMARAVFSVEVYMDAEAIPAETRRLMGG